MGPATALAWALLVLAAAAALGLLILIGGLRLLLKPVMNVVGGVVCETKINGYRTTWWFRFLEYTLDLTASVKIARPSQAAPCAVCSREDCACAKEGDSLK